MGACTNKSLSLEADIVRTHATRDECRECGLRSRGVSPKTQRHRRGRGWNRNGEKKACGAAAGGRRKLAIQDSILRNGTGSRKETEGEHILVCLSSAPSNAKIIRSASKMATAFGGRFTALFVETPDFQPRPKRISAG